jgi:DHA1 family tetracycline resistance protein-like MFS transporter
MQAAVSKSVDARMQGITLGSTHSINSLAMVLGPLIGNGILAQVADLPPSDIRIGATFYFCAVLNLIAFLILWWRLSRSREA